VQPQDAGTNATTRPLRTDPDEISGALAARRELGADAEQAVIAAFLARMGQAIDERVDQRLAEREATGSTARPRATDRPGPGARAVLAIFSMLIGFGVTGVALNQLHGWGIIVVAFVWAVIYGINENYGKSK
jgi:hypothetical protein